MAAPDANVRAWLEGEEQRDTLCLIVCGSVDDGKSTLIGRLLHDSGAIPEDQLAAVAAASRQHGTQGDATDLALLMDGLQAEREQGITIDVAYRFFSTARRRFIVADAPGHEQYTRNMATGASHADLAVLLVDARKGILTQTRRHSHILALLGLDRVVLAVNKMDLAGWDEALFKAIAADYRRFAAGLAIDAVRAIPVSALTGANLFRSSPHMPWYRGPTLLQALDEAPAAADAAAAPFRMAVQWVNRPGPDFRGYAGIVAAGSVRAGDRIRVWPGGRGAAIRAIVAPGGGDLEAAVAGQSVTLTLGEELDIGRGDLLAGEDGTPPHSSDQFAARLLWLADEPLLPQRQYLLKAGAATVTAQVTALRHRIDVDSLEHNAARTLRLNEIGLCNLALDRPIAFDSYSVLRETGAFILIDRNAHATVGAGMISAPLPRAANLGWHEAELDKQRRARQKGQRPCMLWFTGLSGAGKSTAAARVESKLAALGRHSYLLDGDNIRHGLNRDLGFTDGDRVENVRRIAEVARLFVDAGLIVLVSLISPFRDERRLARGLVEEGEFVEVFVDTPLALCERRDPKGLYRKARAGEIRNFTGIDSGYEPPENPEIVLKAGEEGVEELAEQVIRYLEQGGYL